MQAPASNSPTNSHNSTLQTPFTTQKSYAKIIIEPCNRREREYKEIVQTFENETDELVHLTVKGDEITTTPKNPFYVPHKGWTSAIDLRALDILVLSNGEYVVVEKVEHEILEGSVKVYNFEVRDFHTYYVGENSVLVHNQCTNDLYRAVGVEEYEDITENNIFRGVEMELLRLKNLETNLKKL